MGLTYKALKYRDIKTNVTNAKGGGLPVDAKAVETIAQQEAATLSIEASTAQVNATTTTLPENQQQFTADHIMKLCLFLAEKSRAKQLQQSQQMNARRFYENFLQEAAVDAEEDQMLCDNDADNVHNYLENFENKLKSSKTKLHISTAHQTSPRTIRRTKIKTTEKHIKHSVLTDKFSTSSSTNFLNYSQLPDVCEKTHESTQNLHQQQQYHHHQQDKRDILLKIRQQIFERKRLRQVLSGGQRQNAQYPLATQQHHQHQQQQQLENGYNDAQLQEQVELQRLADVWRPW
ncbi:putative cyclin-dependent serine/threonine-protein kinase DDB_G0272797/DDB_G0274007 [Bactrocera tryoni]|uniref:putative cyclin-dependent serine/threonine-protein kinase DDB_G0272797/DDB_G0274007 n=1 Tax=Bactrocera tryoni TaxID=59916 RepID=UPI001A9839E6|nr:putative cyclin-dependent serine/threonine-protein kinase DDB_G0272797/DDB_G0274007 [Bactrocera tryoni]